MLSVKKIYKDEEQTIILSQELQTHYNLTILTGSSFINKISHTLPKNTHIFVCHIITHELARLGQ